MKAQDRFRIAIVAPFPSPHATHEGWMTRIASIDRQLAGIQRVYLDFSEHHADFRGEVARHDRERAEVLLNPSGDGSMDFVSKLAETVNLFYVHTLHLAEYMLPWLNTGKVCVDIHGVTPEEEELLGRSHLRERYETVEREVLGGARCCICVSESMAEHYADKYPSLLPTWLTLPICPVFPGDPELHRNPSTDDRRPVALYSGGTQVWQNLDAMLALAESAGEEIDFRFLSHDQATIRRRIEELGVRPPPAVGYCNKAELIAAYRAADFGLVLRDDSPVNRVSCPTKLVEYLSFGLIPVVRSPCLGDFDRFGYAYVTEEEFKDGLLPDSASRAWMIEHNLRIVEKPKAQFEAGTRALREMVQAGAAGKDDHGDRRNTRTPATAPPAGSAVRHPDFFMNPAKAEEHFHDLRHFRRSVLDRHTCFPCRVLEVGAFSAPTVDPSEAEVKFLDYYATEELRSMARANGADPASVVAVDYVCRTDDYSEVVEESFDVLVANHVLEHVDRTIAWLRMVRNLIRDGGLLFLVLPDKKKSFDRFRPDTPLSHLLYEHLAPEQDVSSVHGFETTLYYDMTYISEENDPAIKLDVGRLAQGIATSHPGVHRHVFQFETFGEKIMKPLLYTGLIDFSLLEIRNCLQFGEFAIVLKAGRDDGPADPGGLFGPATDSLPYLDATRSPGR